MIRRPIEHPPAWRRQSGAALIIALTLMVLAGSSVIINRLNSSARIQAQSQAQTSEALAEAKAALIGYAVSDENRPGELPCPDANNDGQIKITDDYSGSNCTTLRGWFPWQTLDVSDLRDGSGERLWYALSDDFHASGTAILNSETFGQLGVNGASADEDKVVAVIVAPGAPFDGQADRNNPAPDADTLVDEWLDGENADADKTTYRTQAGGDFNDRIVVLTRGELMAAVERRVLGEISLALESYKSNYTAYPWLSPFANPKRSPLTGTAGAGSVNTTLSDPSVDFISDGVRVGDVVRTGDFSQGIAENSLGIIDSVNSTSVTVSSLLGGTNAFAVGADYQIGRHNGVIGANEGHLPFHEIDDPFKTDLVVDWNLQDSNGATVSTSNPSNGIAQYRASLEGFAETTAVSGSVPVAIEEGVCVWTSEDEINCTGRFTFSYFEGTATKNDSDELEDSSLHFDDWGATEGAIVENLDDGGAWAIVDSVNDDTLVLGDDLTGGSSFSVGERYRVRIPTRSTSTITPLIVASGSGTETLQGDPSQDFAALGVEVGDVVQNISDPSPAEWGKITSVGFPSPYNLVVSGLNFDTGDQYVVKYNYVDEREYELDMSFVGLTSVSGSAGVKRRDVCSNDNDLPPPNSVDCRRSGQAQSGSSNLTLVETLITDFSNVSVGDMIENETDGSRGLVSSAGGNTLTVSNLGGGVNNTFTAGDVYRIHLTEDVNDDPLANSDNDDKGSVTIQDRDSGGNGVGVATASVPATGTTTAAMYAQNVRVDLEVERFLGDLKPFDLPLWFTANEWHQLVYVAASSEFVPGGDGLCSKGSDCVTLIGFAPDDDKRALVIVAGPELASAGQDRDAATPLVCGANEPPYFCDYFEGQNADYDDDPAALPPPTFEHAPVSTVFNDQVRIVATEL